MKSRLLQIRTLTYLPLIIFPSFAWADFGCNRYGACDDSDLSRALFFAVILAVFCVVVFILKIFIGIFSKDIRRMSAGHLINQIAAFIGGIGHMLFMIGFFMLIFIGIPVIVIMKLFDLS